MGIDSRKAQEDETTMSEPVLCCGHSRDSNFCPVCGEPLRKLGDLPTLLAYLRTHEKQAKGRLDVRRKILAERNHELLSSRDVVRLRRLEYTHDKWKGWADSLAKMIMARLAPDSDVDQAGTTW